MQNFIISKSDAMKTVVEKLNRFAPLPTPILLTGETGTGKNLLARQIHQLSSRRTGPFVIVDGAALSDNLLESELFGHEKGAFTGAIFLPVIPIGGINFCMSPKLRI